MWTKGQVLILADISQYNIDEMTLGWMWKAGEKVIYVEPDQPSDLPSRSFVTTTHTIGVDARRTVWIFDEYLLDGNLCIWE